MNPPCILVTGGCGYLGSHLLREMAADERFRGARVRVLDNLSSGSAAALCDLPVGPHFEFVEGDILSPPAVRMALDGIDSVVHMAAMVRTPFAFNQPTSIQQINQWGTVQLLEHCREMGVRHFVYASSVSVYGPGSDCLETTECYPLGPYSQSKLNAERAVSGAGSSSMSTSILRLATLYGGEPALMRFDAVANRFCYLAGIGRSLAVYGSGRQARPLVTVSDAARALLFALTNEAAVGETFNVVECNPTIESLAQIIAALRPGVRIHYTDQDYREHFSLSVGGEKIHDAGWSTQEQLQSTLQAVLSRFAGLESSGVASGGLDEV